MGQEPYVQSVVAFLPSSPTPLQSQSVSRPPHFGSPTPSQVWMGTAIFYSWDERARALHQPEAHSLLPGDTASQSPLSRPASPFPWVTFPRHTFPLHFPPTTCLRRTTQVPTCASHRSPLLPLVDFTSSVLSRLPAFTTRFMSSLYTLQSLLSTAI